MMKETEMSEDKAAASILALKKALADKVTDAHEMGTVIKWTASQRYTYAALKTPAGWFTTARLFNGQKDGNGYVDQVYTYEGLLKVLGRAEVSDVQVSCAWLEI